ncbi:hypothetical protein SEA_LUCKYSOCKE_166 [Streptomyces phage LuckySocke]|nr:hypothetical protein SEA_ALONE_168 [Streptomyces phage Alone3]WPH58902.1 hypothetical protein SEA_LUCKYSOCKE_166 [Streptomyces phage LuckySocke]
MKFDEEFNVAYASGYNEGKRQSADKVKTAFTNLPNTADMATKDLLLDLYNEILEIPTLTD